MGILEDIAAEREVRKDDRTIPDNAFEIGGQSPIDGSKKYSFDTIYEDKELISRAKSYYENLYDTKYRNDRDVVDEFIEDRTWKQANIVSVGSEYVDIQGLDAKGREDLAYLQDYWSKLPSFYETGGRGWASGIWSNLWRGALDPTNLLSAGFGSIATKAATKKFGTAFLRKKLEDKTLSKTAKKQINNEIQDIRKRIRAGTYKFPVAKATAVATGSAVAFDASLFGSADLLMQKNEMTIGLRRKGDYDFKRAGTTAIVGAGVSVLPSGFFAYSAVRETSSGLKPLTKIDKEIDPKLQDAKVSLNTSKSTKEKDISKLPPKKRKREETTRKILGETGSTFSDSVYILTQKLFDEYNFFKRFVEDTTEAAGRKFSQSARGVRSFYEARASAGVKSVVDPILESPYIFMRLLSSSLVRAEDVLKNGVLVQRVVKDEFGFDVVEMVPIRKHKDGGFLKIIEPYVKYGEGENFLMYILAKSVLNIHKRNAKLPKTKQQATPFDKKTAERWVDYGELSKTQYKKKYKGVESGRTPGLDFRKGAKQFKGFTDDLLDAKLEVGLISPKSHANIKAAYPDGYIPMWGRKNTDDVVGYFQQLKSRRTGIGATGIKTKKTVGQLNGEIKINPLYASVVDYVNLSYKAMDKNRAKQVFYRMLKKYNAMKVINSNAIAREIGGLETGYGKALTKKSVEDLEKLNIKFEKNKDGTVKGLDEADTTFNTVVFKNSYREQGKNGKVIDVVYGLDEANPGKPTYFEVKSKAMMETFETMSNPTGFTKMLGVLRRFSRLPAKAITYSPPFIAFNFIRDSMTAMVNSAYGFIPAWSSAKGFGLTYTGNANGSNMKKVINAHQRNNSFRMALVNGLGFTSRAETEWNPTLGVSEIERYGNSSAVGWYKKNLNYIGANYIKKGISSYVDFVGRIEYASRMAEYHYAKKSGMSVSSAGAAFMGREVSTDFAMRGSSKALQNYSAITMFFNAGLQGFYKGARTLFKEQPGKAMGTIFAGVVLPEILLWNLNHEYREYRDVPDEVKMMNYLIPIYVKEQADGSHLHEDGTRKIDEFVAIPKPYDFGLFANIATAIMEAVYTKSPGVMTQYMYHSIGIMMPGLALPTIANPIVSLYTNTNWQGDPISPTGFAKLSDRLKYKSNTRESVIQFTNFLYKITGSEGIALRGDGKMGVTVSPIIIDYMINSYFTGLASYPFDIADALLWDEDQFGVLPTERGDRADLWRQPWSIVTRRFRVQTPVKNSKNIKRLYEIKNRADKIKNMKSLSEKDFREILNLEGEIDTKEVQELLGVSAFLSSIADNLAHSRSVRKQIKFSPVELGTNIPYTADRKAQHIKELIQAENEMARIAIVQLRSSNFDTVESDIFGTTYDKTKYQKPNTNTNTDVNLSESLLRKLNK